MVRGTDFGRGPWGLGDSEFRTPEPDREISGGRGTQDSDVTWWRVRGLHDGTLGGDPETCRRRDIPYEGCASLNIRSKGWVFLVDL